MALRDSDPFVGADGAPRVLSGAVLYAGSPRVAEMAARMGFDAVWIDMEHGGQGLRDAEQTCMAVEAGGGIPLVRTCGGDRDHVLRALEIGGRIIVVPMINDADAARRVAKWGKYRPLGERGFFRYSRGLRYGEEDDWMAVANATRVLLPQIETLEAVNNLDGILAVEGVDGILVGPGDLSADMGRPGDFQNAEFLATVQDCLRKARAAGKHAGFLAPNPALIPPALEAGADLVVFANDLPVLRAAWAQSLAEFRAASGR